MATSCHQARKVRHIHHEHGANLVCNRPEASEIDLARIGRAAGYDQLGSVLLCQAFDLIEVDQVIFSTHTILDCVIPFAGQGCLCAMGQMTACIEAQAHDCITRRRKRQHNSTVCLRTGMRLDIGKATVKQLFCALDSKHFHFV